MKFLKASITFILSIIIATSAAAIAGAVAKAETNSINVTLYKDKNLDVIKDDGNFSYSAKVTGNKKAVIVDTEYGDTYTGFRIIGNKLTGSKRATVKIIKTNNITDKSETVKTYKISVKKPKVKKLATIKLSKGQKMVGAIKNDFCRECKLKVRNTKIVKPNGGCPDINTDRDVQLLTFNAKKKGSTTADVYIKNTKVGKVKIKVGAYKPYVDSKNKNVTLKYNSHGRAEDYYGFSEYLRNYDYRIFDKLTYKTDSKYITYNKDDLYPFTINRTGSTTISICHKNKKLASIKAKIKTAKMADVFSNNLGGESDGDFLNYEHCVSYSTNTTYDVFDNINSIVLNNKRKGTNFSKSDYKITYKSNDESTATIDEYGVAHIKPAALQAGSVSFKYTIKFSDKSVYTGTYKILVQ
ncbi:MAG: hypothetical protein VZR54_06755 [Ruminococcus sp.]|jgi:hypothetical protein|nr:hypothetical protein [Ruminococcus sp.]